MAIYTILLDTNGDLESAEFQGRIEIHDADLVPDGSVGTDAVMFSLPLDIGTFTTGFDSTVGGSVFLLSSTGAEIVGVDDLTGSTTDFVRDDYNPASTSNIFLSLDDGSVPGTFSVLDFNIVDGVLNETLLEGQYTIVGGLIGTDANDFLTGSDSDDNIEALAGDDQLFGLLGDDVLIGGLGQDALVGGPGSDTLDGGDEDDEQDIASWVVFDNATSAFISDGRPDGVGVIASLVSGDARDDPSAPGASADVDTLIGIERLVGSLFDDTLIGGEGYNLLLGLDGDDSLNGGADNDDLIGGRGFDTLNGGDGDRDEVEYDGDPDLAAGVNVDLGAGTAVDPFGDTDTLINVEAIRGTIFADTMLGSSGSDRLRGAAGDDEISGLGGDDELNGGAGNDTLDGGEGDGDLLTFVDDDAAVFVNLAMGTATDGEGGMDTLLNLENVRGSDFDDEIIGSASDNVLRGDFGNDTLDGGSGTDTAILEGASGNYILTLDGTTPSFGIADKRDDGTGQDTLTRIERLEFGDGFSFSNDGIFDLREITGAVGLSEDMLLTFSEMYVAYFDRAPDALGLFYWGTRLADGLGLGQIAQSFFFQEETYALYPELDGLTEVSDPSTLSVEFYESVVTDTYNKLLERAPDDAGKAYWIAELQNGNVDLGEFALAAIDGAKDFNPNGATADQIAQAEADRLTVEQKGQLGFSFAVDGGMNDLGNAAEVISIYDITDRDGSIAAAEALIAEYRAAAEALNSTEIVIQITNLGEDPLAIA